MAPSFLPAAWLGAALFVASMALAATASAMHPQSNQWPAGSASAQSRAGMQHPLAHSFSHAAAPKLASLMNRRFGILGNATVCNVQAFGAKGDGTTDDTRALQSAFTACANGGEVVIGEGAYLITSTIFINGSLDVRGAGNGAVLLWAASQDMLVWTVPATMMVVSDLTIASIGSDKPTDAAALRFKADCTKSTFENLLFIGRGPVQTPRGPVDTSLLGTCLDLGPVTDTVEVRGCLLWFLQGTGIAIGRGSEVRISGGRVIGQGTRNDSSIGIHVRGNNGGVHIESTDVIALHVGILLKDTLGVGSNREIFIDQATMDSDWRGMEVWDNSYISVSGCWAASSDQDQIWVSPDSHGALLVISGGTIFNGGALGGDPAQGQCNGLTVNAGSFMLSGVAVRYNKGVGVWVPGKVENYVISGNQIFNNGRGALLGGSSYTVVGNVFHDNAEDSDLGQTGVVANNAFNPR